MPSVCKSHLKKLVSTLNESYGEIDPDLKVPALIIQEKKLTESLLPSDPVKRAQIRFVIEFVTSKIIGPFKVLIQSFKEEVGRQKYIESAGAAYSRLNELLLEQAHSGHYFLGSQYSLVDIAIAPILAGHMSITEAFMNGIALEAMKTVHVFKNFKKE
ncbi:glutathione S-transferase [Zychaea mexicana]|uniref:glutathione S-transferase n=1 Tax=Zychaea mexicana TaxID=64656 RepID=UPI0022FED365|nr:glutathione S-transferase [Zychaea mexicana]KAI9497216.1 glutathione S-transferase [Zychaea mexicana]